MPISRERQDREAIAASDDFITQFKSSVKPSRPWDHIIDFVRHPDFCNMRMYPRQETLLKLIYLETDLMTDYDLTVIDEWTKNFGKPKNSFGVQPDIWERIEYLKGHGYDHFPHVQNVAGRRAGKGVVGGICGAERMAFMVSLDNPQDYYGINADSIYLSVVATSLTQAKKFLFADIRKTVERNKWLAKRIVTDKDYMLTLQTPGDVRRIADMRARKVPIGLEISSVRAMALSSSSSAGRGGSGFANMYDELAHGISGTDGEKDTEAIYTAYQPSLDQFGKDAFTYIPSSPFTKVGVFYDLYVSGSVLTQDYMMKSGLWTPKEIDESEKELDAEEGLTDLTADPEMLIIQLPSWETYTDWERGPELVGTKFKRAIQVPPWGDQPENLKMARLKKRNPLKFKVEREAQFAEVIDAYLDSEKVDRMFDPFWGGRVLEQESHGRLDRAYHGHSDPSKTNANFAAAIGHLEQAPEPDEYGNFWHHVVFDFTHVWDPANFPDHTIDYVEIENELESLLERFPSMVEYTFDGWNSAGFISKLNHWAKARNHGVRIRVEDFTSKRNQEVAEKFKSAVNLGWVHVPQDTLFNNEASLLANELKFLTERNGKVQKQATGPITTKDLADCVMEVTVRLLEDQLDNWHKVRLGTTHLEAGVSNGWPQAGTGKLDQRQNNPTRNINPERAQRNRDALDSFRSRGSTSRLRGW